MISVYLLLDFDNHYSRILKYSTICYHEVANPYISTFFSVIKVLKNHSICKP